MNKFETATLGVSLMLLAIAVGEYAGTRFLHGIRHIGKILTIFLVLIAVLGLFLTVIFRTPLVYISWMPLFVGALGHGASRRDAQ